MRRQAIAIDTLHDEKRVLSVENGRSKGSGITIQFDVNPD
jgi:hypothetical protein